MLMHTIIDKLDNPALWTGTLPAQINEHPEFIAHENTASTIINVAAGDQGKIATLALNTDLTGYEYIVLDCVSIYNGVFRPPFNYMIDFGFQKYYFNAPPVFGPVKFKIAGVETITKIEITALHNERDVLILSHLQAVKEELPLDIIKAFETQIEPVEYTAGDAVATIGSNTITFDQPLYVDRYAKIRLGSKHYSIESLSGNTATINTLYDGAAGIAESYSGPAHMVPSVESYSRFKEVVLPGITIYDDTPELIDVDNREGYRLDTFKINTPADDTVDIVEFGDNYALPIQIDAESQYEQVLADMVSKIKKLVAKRTLWVNGVLLEIKSLQARREEGEYEKISFVIVIEYAEEQWTQTQKFPLSGTQNITINPKTP